MDPVPSLAFTRVDDCCNRITWKEPYSLAGVPILGYNLTSTDLNIDSFVTGFTESVVCSDQLRQHNATVAIQAYNGLDGDVASVDLDYNIGECMYVGSFKGLLLIWYTFT